MAYSYRNTASAWDSDGSVASSAITTVAGDTLIGLTIGVGDLRTGTPLGASTTMTLTDSKGNIMARLGPAVYFSTDDFTAQAWISQGIQNSGSSHSWTVAGAGATACAVAVVAYSGLAAKYSLAAFSTNTQAALGTGTNAAVSGSDTNTGHANCLVLGFGYSGEGLPNAGTGFTSRAAIWPLGGGPNVLRVQDLRATSVASQQATFTNTTTSNNLSVMVVLKEDDAQVNEVLQLTDTFTGSSGTELSAYNTNWHAPNGGNKLKGSNQAGPSIIGGGAILEDTPLHRVDFLPSGDHWAKISADEFTTGYCAALTRCLDGQGYDQLSHYGHGVEATGRNLYIQNLGALTTFLAAAAPAEGVDIGCHSVGKFHYASVDDVVDLIYKDTQLTGGYWGAGSVADGTDGVRWSNFRCGIVGPAATVVTAVTPDTFDDADTGIVVDGSVLEASQGAGGIVISPVAHPSGDIPPYPSMGTPGLDLAVTSGTSNGLNMPANITAGDLLLAFIAHDRNGSATAIALSGWTDITNASNSTVVGLAIFAKIAAGGDTGTVTASNNDLVAKVYRVPAAVHGVTTVSSDILKGTAATGSSGTPNPPSVSGLTSGLKYLVIEVAASDDDDDTANYSSTNYQKCLQLKSTTGTSSCLIQIATRQLTGATSEDPGNMALAASEEWVAQTLAIPQRASVGLAVPQTETAWGATQVTITAVKDYLAYDVPLHLFAGNNAGGWNWGGFAVQFEAGGGGGAPWVPAYLSMLRANQ